MPTASATITRARALLARFPLVDGHNDLPWAVWMRANRDLDRLDLGVRQGALQTDLPRLREGGLGAQFWVAYVPCDKTGDVAVRTALEQIDLIHEMIARYSDTLEFAWTADDVVRIHQGGRLASLIGVEGGHCLGESLGVLRAFWRLGARYLTLTHSANTTWADSATDERAHGGLTEFGEAVVRELNRLGMLVDLAHVSVEVMHHALRVTQAPVVFTHSSARALSDHVRNVPDDVLTQVADNGGTVMVAFVPSFVNEAVRQHWAMRRVEKARLEAAGEPVEPGLAIWDAARSVPRAQLTDVADHIDHIRDVAGIDHVGIGADFDGIESTPRGLEDVSKYVDLIAELLRRGYSDDDVEKVVGGNVLRTMRAAEAAARSFR